MPHCTGHLAKPQQKGSMSTPTFPQLYRLGPKRTKPPPAGNSILLVSDEDAVDQISTKFAAVRIYMYM